MTQPHPQPTEYSVDILKFDTALEKYIEDFATFSKREKEETLEEIHDIVMACSSPHTPAAPATGSADPAGDCDTCRFVKECTPLYLPPCYNGRAIMAAQAEREKVLEKLYAIKNHAMEQYKEADLSDNEDLMMIHLDYENMIWDIMQSLRGGAEQGGSEQ